MLGPLAITGTPAAQASLLHIAAIRLLIQMMQHSSALARAHELRKAVARLFAQTLKFVPYRETFP